MTFMADLRSGNSPQPYRRRARLCRDGARPSSNGSLAETIWLLTPNPRGYRLHRALYEERRNQAPALLGVDLNLINPSGWP